MVARPGDILRARRVETPGYCRSLILEAGALSGYLAEHQSCLEQLRLPLCLTMSLALRARFVTALDSLGSATSLLESQASITAFVAGLLAERAGLGIVESKRGGDAAVHVRQRLQKDTTGEVDLETLARETGLSRFQLLRAFKRRFGIPPQAYRMQMRIAMARKLLRSGMAPAGVAAELGFVDQSHMTRHFKRAVGITPARYAKSTTPR
jgi:AraC-like DNA-binding protein